MLFITAICCILWVWQMDHQTTETSRSRLKLSLDRATHDAAMQLDKNVLAREGRIVFTSQARTVFDQTLQTNLKFNESYYPKANNLFNSADRLEVLVFDRVETGCPGSPSGSGFPCTYVNTTHGYIDTLRGPSIVAVIKMKHPQSYGVAANKSYIVGSSHEYIGY